MHKISIKSYFYKILVLSDFREIMKLPLHNFYKILKKCFFGTIFQKIQHRVKYTLKFVEIITFQIGVIKSVIAHENVTIELQKR